jgi:hypothetical protein
MLPICHAFIEQVFQPTRPLDESQDCRAGTTARRDNVRVFRQVSWLEAGSAKTALPRPAHERVTRTVGQLRIQIF